VKNRVMRQALLLLSVTEKPNTDTCCGRENSCQSLKRNQTEGQEAIKCHCFLSIGCSFILGRQGVEVRFFCYPKRQSRC
jgi:hypothetical protein